MTTPRAWRLTLTLTLVASGLAALGPADACPLPNVPCGVLRYDTGVATDAIVLARDAGGWFVGATPDGWACPEAGAPVPPGGAACAVPRGHGPCTEAVATSQNSAAGAARLRAFAACMDAPPGLRATSPPANAPALEPGGTRSVTATGRVDGPRWFACGVDATDAGNPGSLVVCRVR